MGIRPEAKPKQWTHDRRDVPCAIVEPLATWRIAEKMVIRIRASMAMASSGRGDGEAVDGPGPASGSAAGCTMASRRARLAQW